MKLIRAKFDGFRLLNGVELVFSTDRERNITVIRAANESGKTTMLHALQWCLFGDDALPSSYNLFSMDLSLGETSKTCVEIDYEIEGKRGMQRYKIIRSLIENVGTQMHGKSDAQLYEITLNGTKEIPNVEAYLAAHMPSELREVFFTDGDRALSFIEGKKTEQQKRVKKAIEQLMGLPMLEKAVSHIKASESDLRSKADEASGNQELHAIRVELEKLDTEIPAISQQLETLKDQITHLNELHAKANSDLEEALKRGNREEIARELARVRKHKAAAEGRIKTAESSQAGLLSNKTFARELLRDKMKAAGQILDVLRQKGQIPNKTIPILEDRLRHSDCICGESLDKNTQDGMRRRKYIEKLIEDSKDADALRSKVSDLYFEGRDLFQENPAQWLKAYAEAFKTRNLEQRVYGDLCSEEANLEVRLAKVQDDDVQRAREMRDTYQKQLQECISEVSKYDVSLKGKIARKVEKSKLFDVLSKKEKKGRKYALELQVARDIKSVFEGTLDLMKTREVQSVSSLMNEYFLQMIGADPENALIQKAAIDSDFRIVVHGRNNRVMDPSLDLNGASRRALTIAFVLALTEVSGVEAPNVIDTPLGMMSGFVKTAVVKVASEASDQLILFLTHDEIKGCEDILDEKAGRVMTVTNPVHYPKILKNDPGTSEAKALLCQCDHRNFCKLCERRESARQPVVAEVGNV
ncbi:AAA family ATPase [Pararhodospirillum photometricum]|uniref:ABC transporter ATP-binding protein n=1 Tax=Pararhodospirillum photometricum DSM 122 TaxID=1150469 RepID=H6SL64_PARPM|nr:AAA family ATPase [Pararhodospirillum photometricum]CCG08729.1 ABC transporter ATP-binding protein [Pararhodospirillum photometricum DSM 122]